MSKSGYLALITQIFATIGRCVSCPLSQGTLDLIWGDMTQRLSNQLFMQLNSTTIKQMPLCFVSCHPMLFSNHVIIIRLLIHSKCRGQ